MRMHTCNVVVRVGGGVGACTLPYTCVCAPVAIPHLSRSFQLTSMGSTEEGGWSGRLSKWQWALAIGLPVAAAAGVAGLTLFLSRRRATEVARDRSPPPSMSLTPVASPAATTVHKTESSGGKETVSMLYLHFVLLASS